jgi:GTP-binding protein
MPQTRFVLKKALELGQTVVVVVNKVDRPSARPDYVVNTTFELFVELNASDEQVCEFRPLFAVFWVALHGMGTERLSWYDSERDTRSVVVPKHLFVGPTAV